MRLPRGHCVECCRPYGADQIEDGLCPVCRALDPRNEPELGVEEGPSWKYSKAAMRERLGVSGDRDE